MVSSRTRRKNAKQIAFLAVAVIIVLVATLLFQQWWADRKQREPEEVSITVSTGGENLEVFPFSICEPGVPCEEAEVPEISLNKDQSLKVTVPEDIADHDWTLLKIYDDPKANDEQAFGPHEATEASAPAVVEEYESKLVVCEVTSVMIGHDDEGNETPYRVTWSVRAKVND
ncbi:DUF2771 domain-containing protein [Corynebacterium pelargi]|uniref:Uncharacterized protein n=1 Tax=Corynebacterium pelargi TaxID=1471400 RepID=A0A410WA62_9CORY|nr:DUF2771 domain-containing protein [Corynebacterium pelargi]QAU52835.1 hypothetical protein CPELA_07880 [Corynebacterium pelargi]GGG79080.1 hypothetical protein GCM10007338_16670 [Corynebacterium pelargi]